MAKGAYIGVSYTPLSPTFSANTWEQIIYACRNNIVPDTWTVGSQKSMTIGDTDYLIDIIGKNHDTFSDGSGVAPLTLMMHDVYETQYPMNTGDSTTNGWDGSVMRNTHLPSILKLMPNEVQAGIKEVNKLAASSGGSSTIKTSSDKLFLLSEIEILGYASSSSSGEGSQYAYYANGNAVDKYLNGTRMSWWLRSPYKSDSSKFCAGWMTNSLGAYPASSTTPRVSFAFCFGGTTSPSSVARKIKKGYVGIENLARKIKKAYIGIGGVARPCWSSSLEYYGTITPLSQSRQQLAAASVGDYALFVGGYPTSAVVDAYTSSLVRSTPTPLHYARYNLAGATAGNYAVFPSGYNGGYTAEMDAYNASLTQFTQPQMTYGRYGHAGASLSGCAFFGGGAGGSRIKYVIRYDGSLSKIESDGSILTERTGLAAASVGGYVVFAGGYKNSALSTVEACNATLTKYTNTMGLSVARYDLAGASVGNYAIFAGGRSSGAVDAYDASLTRTVPEALSSARERMAATSVGGYAIFQGGCSDTGANVRGTDYYDASLTRTVLTADEPSRQYHAATTIGKYAIFAGGATGGTQANHAWAYTAD